MRKYGLFMKVGRRWVRLFPRREYGLQTARAVFQSLLIDLFFRGKHVGLRPVKKPALVS